MPLSLRPAAALFGAEIGGIDLRAPLTREQRDELQRLLQRYRVLFFRGQQLSTAHQIEFAEAFGPILIFRSVVPADPSIPECTTWTAAPWAGTWTPAVSSNPGGQRAAGGRDPRPRR